MGRIAIVAAYTLPHLGGIEQFVHNLSEELARRGRAVTVITCNSEGLASYEMLPSGVEVFRLPCVSLAGNRFPKLVRNAEFRRIDRLLSSEDFAGMLVNTRFYETTPYALDLAARTGTKAVVLDHGSGPLGFGVPALDWAVRAYERGMTWRVRRKGPDFYGVSQMSAAWLGHFGIRARGVIHNAIDAPAFRAQASGRAFRSELGVGEDALLVAYTGRLLSDKGVWELVEVARALEVRGANVRFAVAGDGPERDALAAAAPESVALLGRLSKPDVAALLLASNAFLFPSSYPEGLPTSVLEASACGLATIGTDVGGMREVLPSREYGVVYERFDASDCVRLLEGFSRGREELARMGERCRARVEREFSWRKTADAALEALLVA